VGDVRWDGREAVVNSRLLGGPPALFTSSGLGDHVVEGVRRALFEELFAGPPGTWAVAQEAYHRHRWPGREHLSVNMTRETARTVSFAVIDIGPGRATFGYRPGRPDEAGELAEVELELKTRLVGG
jgi:hypothetical protein